MGRPYQETLAITWARDDGGLDQGLCRNAEDWPDFGYVLVEPTAFAGWLHGMCERKESRMNSGFGA